MPPPAAMSKWNGPAAANSSTASVSPTEQFENGHRGVEHLRADHSSAPSRGMGLLIGATVGSSVLLAVLGIAFVLWRKRSKSNSSSVSMSKGIVLSTSNQAGVIQSEKIEFVLPSAYNSAEPTEEEASEQEAGHYRYSYIHAPPGGNILTVPHQAKRGLNPSSIAPALYLSSEGEEEQDVWSPPNANLGKIGFSIQYKGQDELLLVTILGACNVLVKRRKGVSNLHVKLTLLPDKCPKFFTRVVKNTLNPVFNEDFGVALKPEQAPAKILKITMCDFDKFSRRIAIGHVFLPLKNLGIEVGSADTVLLGEVWKSLVPKYLESEEIRGEVSLSLCYNSDIRNLRLGIHKVKNLNSKQDDKEIACLYAKVTLFEDGKVIKTRKTSAKRKTFEPDFAETFNIKVSRERIQNIYCMVSICSRNRYGNRKVIGRTQIGPYTHVSGPGADHWNDAFQSPKSTVTQWHVLR